jgi:hypothetical protein
VAHRTESDLSCLEHLPGYCSPRAATGHRVLQDWACRGVDAQIAGMFDRLTRCLPEVYYQFQPTGWRPFGGPGSELKEGPGTRLLSVRPLGRARPCSGIHRRPGPAKHRVETSGGGPFGSDHPGPALRMPGPNDLIFSFFGRPKAKRAPKSRQQSGFL